MQSGTTGINTTRVYNPIKQAQDHDPQGKFVRRWLPAMRSVPDTWLFEPWMMPKLESTDATQTPEIVMPLVDLATATKTAKHRVHERRRDPEVKAGKKAVIEKHASRKKSAPVSRPTRPRSDDKQQLGFDF